MAKALIGVSLLTAAAALVVAVGAFREARESDEVPTYGEVRKSDQPPTYGEVTAAGVREFASRGGRLTPAQALLLFGKPDETYRNNPRALCWRYTATYDLEMCWGPRRQRAWIGHNVPLDLVAFTLSPTSAGAATAPTVPFASLPHGWYAGIPRDVRKDSRLVGVVGGRPLAVAPTRSGSFCLAFKGRFAGCRVRGPALIGSTAEASSGSVQSVGGSVLGHPGRSLYLRYADGTEKRIRLTHVGSPINASFFYIDIPRTHWVKSRRALSLELRDGRRVIERALLPLPRRS